MKSKANKENKNIFVALKSIEFVKMLLTAVFNLGIGYFAFKFLMGMEAHLYQLVIAGQLAESVYAMAMAQIIAILGIVFGAIVLISGKKEKMKDKEDGD